MQGAIGALAGWVNVSGRIFRVGDRIQMGGVQGDVIDLTPLRIKILEIGSAAEDASWVKGRQYTGRIVAVSDKATFTEPVYNYSSVFEFIWEELTVPIAYRSDRWADPPPGGGAGLRRRGRRAGDAAHGPPLPRCHGPSWSRGCSPAPPTTGRSCRPASWSRCGLPARSRTP